MRFQSIVELGGKTATGIRVPEEVVTGLGSHRRPPVRVTVGAHTYRTTVAPMGGAYFVPLSAENRNLAGVAAGDQVDVDIELDTAPREVTVPAELAAALEREPGARRAFDALSTSRRREHARQVETAKAEATRQRRIAKVLDELRGH
ncbi:MAG TPA: YdeI/OmpD-associated family protein [Pseudonocardia sp.]|nr:YdeI/OmpD-associated family protein [Pseudonocardia sp.]